MISHWWNYVGSSLPVFLSLGGFVYYVFASFRDLCINAYVEVSFHFYNVLCPVWNLIA